MKKMFNFRSLAILCLAIGLVVSLTRCKKYDDDVNRLQTQISALKADVAKDFKEKVDGQMGTLEASVKSNVARLDALEKQSASGADVQSKIDAAKKELMDNLVSKEAYEKFVKATDAKIAAAVTKDQLDAVNTKFQGIEGRLAALEALKSIQDGTSKALNDFKAEYAKAYDMLKGDIANLTKKIEANANSIKELRELISNKVDNSTLEEVRASLGNKADKSELAKLNTDLTALIKDLQNGKADKSEVEALNKKLDKFLTKDLKVTVAALTGRLSGLVLLPEYVSDKGGALPVLNFSAVKTQCDNVVTPKVLVRYLVNPSNADVKQIKKDGLTFLYNDPMVAAKSNEAGVDQKAKFVSLKDGVLTVEASLDASKLWASKDVNPENRIDQLMLQVPLTDGNVISSDWAKVVSGFREVVLAKNDKKVQQQDLPKYVLKSTLAEAEAIDVKDHSSARDNYTVVDLAYNKNLDLTNVFKALYDNYTSLDTEAYGANFKFDFKDKDGKDISYIVTAKNQSGNSEVTKTNQQDFIEFVPGSTTQVRAKLFDKNGNNLRAAIGRTPILHVSLVKGDCVVADGFVKLNIVDNDKPVVRERVYNATINAGCVSEFKKNKYGDAIVDSVNTEKMNKDFYQAVPMSREEFKNNYYFTYRIPSETLENQVGYVNDPARYAEYEKLPISTTNLLYSLRKDVVSNKDYYGKTVSRTVYFVRKGSNYKDYFKVTFNVKINAPKAVTVNRFNQYWKDSYAVQNVAVDKNGSTNSSECTWENNINAVFQSKDLNLALPEGYSYEYVFTKDEQFKVDGVQLTVSENGKELKAGDEVVAFIKDHNSSNKGDLLSYNPNSKIGKKLLNSGKDAMKAKLTIKVLNGCDMPVSVNIDGLNSDKFVLHFLRPINFSTVSTGYFQDGVSFGSKGSYLDVLDVINLSDWRGFSFKKHKNFYGYYGVSSILLDKDHVMLKGSKQPLPKTIELNQVFDHLVDASKPYYGKLTYKNNGSNLQQNLTLVVPVTVTYKWGEIVSETVEITVKKTSEVSDK